MFQMSSICCFCFRGQSCSWRVWAFNVPLSAVCLVRLAEQTAGTPVLWSSAFVVHGVNEPLPDAPSMARRLVLTSVLCRTADLHRALTRFRWSGRSSMKRSCRNRQAMSIIKQRRSLTMDTVCGISRHALACHGSRPGFAVNHAADESGCRPRTVRLISAASRYPDEAAKRVTPWIFCVRLRTQSRPGKRNTYRPWSSSPTEDTQGWTARNGQVFSQSLCWFSLAKRMPKCPFQTLLGMTCKRRFAVAHEQSSSILTVKRHIAYRQGGQRVNRHQHFDAIEVSARVMWESGMTVIARNTGRKRSCYTA